MTPSASYCHTNYFYCRIHIASRAWCIMSWCLSHLQSVREQSCWCSGSRRLMRRQGRPVTAMDCARADLNLTPVTYLISGNIIATIISLAHTRISVTRSHRQPAGRQKPRHTHVIEESFWKARFSQGLCLCVAVDSRHLRINVNIEVMIWVNNPLAENKIVPRLFSSKSTHLFLQTSEVTFVEICNLFYNNCFSLQYMVVR